MPRQRRPAEHMERAQRLGRLLREHREARSLSREALARMALVSLETIRKIEAGLTGSPELFTIAAIAHHLAISLDEIVYAAQAPERDAV